MATTYDFDEDAASNADKAANRIDQGAYVGRIKQAYKKVSENTGTEGVHIDFVASAGGQQGFDLWTRKADGTKIFGQDQLQAIMACLGLRGLESKAGKYTQRDFDAKADVEKEGELFPALCDKDIGLVFQKELITKQDGGDSHRMNIYGVFRASDKLTASEIREKKVKPEKLERMLKGLKSKDSRKPRQEEPAQPSIGAEAGSF
jgi:hypothetical protein